jgi:hypothetical protein
MSITPAIESTLRDVGESSLKEKFLPLVQSFYSELRRSNVGKITADYLEHKIEPMIGLGEKSSREFLEPILNSVPHDLHQEMTDVALGKKTSTNTAVQSAGQKLGQFYNSTKAIGGEFSSKSGHPSMDWISYGDKVAKEKVIRSAFGMKKEQLARIIVAAQEEKGIPYANNIADHMSMYLHEPRGDFPIKWRQLAIDAGAKIRGTSSYVPADDVEQSVRRAASLMYLGRIAIKHLSQYWTNGVINGGINQTVKAFTETIANPKEARDFLINSGSFEHELRFEMLNALNNEKTGLWGKLVGSLVHPGFNTVRRVQMGMGAVLGKNMAEKWTRDLLTNGITRENEIQLKFLGLDPNSILKNKGLSELDTLIAARHGVNNTMFIRSELTTPPIWHQSWIARTMTLYNDFAFTQGHNISKVLRRDYESGGYLRLLGTVGKLATIWPVFGEMVTSLERMARLQDPTTRIVPGKPGKEQSIAEAYENNPVQEYIDAMGMSAGWSIAYGLVRAAKRRMLAAHVVGPIIGTLTDLGDDVATGSYKSAGRRVTGMVPVIGPAIGQQLFPPGKDVSTIPKGTY